MTMWLPKKEYNLDNNDCLNTGKVPEMSDFLVNFSLVEKNDKETPLICTCKDTLIDW